MPRKVKVELEADISKFVAPVEASKKAIGELDDKVSKLDRDLEKVPPDAMKAAAALKLLGTEADTAGKKLSDINDKRTNLAALDSKIRSTTAEVRKLADEFAKTGDVDVFKKLGDAQGRLSALTKIRKEVTQSIEDGLKEGFTNPGSWPGFAEAAQQAALRFAAPVGGALLAAVGGALAGGVGMGVAGLGLAGAVMGDPERFKGAWGAAVRDVESQFFNSTSIFTEDVYAGIARIGPLVKSWNLKQVFADAEKYATPLFQGIEGLSTGLVKGIGALVEKGQPAVDSLSDSMIMLGDASQSALTSIADGAKGGAYALHDLSAGVAGVIEGFGKLTEGAEKAYEYIHDHPLEAAIGTGGMSLALSAYQKATESGGRLGDTQEGLRQKAIAAGQATDGLTASQLSLSEATIKASHALNSQLDNLLSLDRANDAAANGVDRLKESLRQNGNAIDGNSKAAEANRQVLQGVIGDYIRQRDAAVAAGDQTAVSVGQANAVLRKHLEELRAVLAAHGDDTSAVDRYIQRLDSLDGKVISVRVDLSYTSHLPSGISLGNLLHRASGGPVTAGEAYIVGENQPELFVPSVNGKIMPSLNAFASASGGGNLAGLASMAPSPATDYSNIARNDYAYAGAGPAGGTQTLRVVLQYPDGRVIRDQVVEWNANRGRSDPAMFFLP